MTPTSYDRQRWQLGVTECPVKPKGPAPAKKKKPQIKSRKEYFFNVGMEMAKKAGITDQRHQQNYARVVSRRLAGKTDQSWRKNTDAQHSAWHYAPDVPSTTENT